MTMVRSALLLVPGLLLLPACGHKGPPLPPRRHTPPNLVDFRLAQRGEALEMTCSAPTASVDGVAFRHVDIELFWGEGWIDLEKEGQRRRLRAEPGARVVEEVPLPEPGTLVRAAGRAVSGGDEGQRSLILALETHEPPVAPHDLTARLRPMGVGLNWRGPRPEALPPPDLGPVGGTRRPFSMLSDPFDDEPDSPGDTPGSPDDTPGSPDDEPGSPEDEPGSPEDEPGSPEDEPGSSTESPSGESAAPPEPADPSETPAPTGEETSSEAAPPSPGADIAVDDPTLEAEVSDEETDDEAAPAEPEERGHGFRVYRRLASSVYRVPLNYEPQERRLFTDTAAPLGASVCYVIRAVGSVEPLIESAASNEVCLDVRDIAPPAPPTGLAVVPRPGGLEVVWSPSSEADLGGYRIYRADGEGEPEKVGEVPAGTTAWLDTTPQTGRLYRYTVTAFDGAGNEGPPSGAAQGRGP